MVALEDAGLTARPADHLDSTYTCLNNPENRQRISRTESPEPNADKRPTEEGRKGGKAVCAPRTGAREPGGGVALGPIRALESGLQKQRGWTEGVCSHSKHDLDLASGRS